MKASGHSDRDSARGEEDREHKADSKVGSAATAFRDGCLGLFVPLD